jgi:hypothetical protein
MRFHRLLIAIAVSAFVCAASAQAEVVLGNLGASGTGAVGTTGFQFGSSVAIPFVTGSSAANLTDVVIGVQGDLVASQNVAATLYANNGGVPASTPLGWTDSVTVLSSAGPSAITFSATPFQLSPSTNYWMVVSPDVAMTWIAANPTATPTSQNGSDWSYPAGGALAASEGFWNPMAQDNAFSVSATAVPEPGTLALAAFAGVAGLASLRLRRRKRQA